MIDGNGSVIDAMENIGILIENVTDSIYNITITNVTIINSSIGIKFNTSYNISNVNLSHLVIDSFSSSSDSQGLLFSSNTLENIKIYKGFN